MMQLVLRKSRKGNVTVGRGGSIFGGTPFTGLAGFLQGAKKNAEHQSSNRGQQHIVLKVIHTCLQVICF